MACALVALPYQLLALEHGVGLGVATLMLAMAVIDYLYPVLGLTTINNYLRNDCGALSGIDVFRFKQVKVFLDDLSTRGSSAGEVVHISCNYEMDRETWMYNIDRFTPDYVKGLSEFMKCAEAHRKKVRGTLISCPCVRCRNIMSYDNSNTIRHPLIEHDFDTNYTCWNLHGEIPPQVDNDTIVSDFNMDENFGNDDNHRDNLDEMLHDTKSNADEKNVNKLQQLFDDAEKPLFEGSFPKDNELPVTTYHAKKLTCPMGLAVERIHACRNDCILYRKDYKDLHECPVCKVSRYKQHKNLMELDSDVTKNGPPAKMLGYLPIIPRLKKLYANPKDDKLLRWHAEERKTDGKMRHVAESPQWKNIDRDFKKFGSEIRNIRFGLCSDGINPFKILSSRHSTWPVLLCIYNLPPWLCMKRKYIMMSLLIQGVEIYDAYKKERFQLFAMIYCTINNFPAYVLDHEKLEELQRDIILILCQLEMYFPPSFFDVMVHLVSLIVEEIKIARPVFLWYMYLFERYMGFLKGYVRNRYRPEGSIIQGLEGVGTIRRKDVTPKTEDSEQAHFTVFQNMTCIEPYIQEHMSYLARKNGRREQRWLEAEHKKTFSQWLADKVIGMSPSNVDAYVIQIGYRPRRVLQYQGYDINGYTFYTKKQDDKSTVQNSGVTLIATSTDSSRMEIAKDSYFGVIEEIWELDYTTIVIPILKCKWVDNTRSGKRWHIVLQCKRSIVGVDDVVDEDEYNKFDELPHFPIGFQSDTIYLRSDHQEGQED
nr:hypothetical protein [Tanacetum cinerariifolium]